MKPGQNSSQGLACNLTAIAAADRGRYSELAGRVRDAILNRSETGEGYTFELSENTVTLSEVGEWIGMERMCCPFLTLQLAASGGRTNWLLTLTGPDGTKPLLRTVFPLR